MRTGELVMDVGTVLDGEQAVAEGLIDEVGSLGAALDWLYAAIDKQQHPRRKAQPKTKTPAAQ